MNFKLLIICFLFTLTACGIKGPPKPPADSALPSLIDHYKKVDKEKKKEQDS
ncbi:MAG: lipoprotein [Bacteriovoracaceae bacterium]|nr:lipoprotein [Bacteriovoracaceae bacterium]